jgi:hypothetical protein
VPRLRSGQSHTLRAEMRNAELRVFVDNHEVWEGDLGPEAAKLERDSLGPMRVSNSNCWRMDRKARVPTTCWRARRQRRIPNDSYFLIPYFVGSTNTAVP